MLIKDISMILNLVYDPMRPCSRSGRTWSRPIANRGANSLIDEVHAEEMQYQAAEDEICECPTESQLHVSLCPFLSSAERSRREADVPFLRHRLKLRLVLRVRLYPQGGREDELADRSAEAGEEGVEGLEWGGFCQRLFQNNN